MITRSFRRIGLLRFATIAWIGSSAICGVAKGQAPEFPTTGTQYIWKVGDGLYSDWGTNYHFAGVIAPNPPEPTAAPSAARDVIFGWANTPATATVSLDPLVTSTGTAFPSNGNARSFSVYDGNYTFDFKGSAANPWSTKIWRFGNGAGNTPLVHFTDSTGANKSIVFGALVIGDAESSNNVFGGTNSTVTFGSNVTYSLSATGTLTVGSTNGGGGNEFNVLAGQNFSRGAITVNAGAGNKITVRDGGILSTAADISMGSGTSFIVEGENSLFSRTGTGSASISGDLIVRDGGKMTTVGGRDFEINAGGSLVVDDATFELTRNLTSFSNTTTEVSGLLEVKNGGVFKSTLTTNPNPPADYALYSIFHVLSSGAILVDGGSSFVTNNQLEVGGGAVIEVKGNSSMEVGIYKMYTGTSGQIQVAATPIVEDGSTFRFNYLQLGNAKYMQGQGFGDDYQNVLDSGGGLLILGAGGFDTGSFSDSTVAHLTLAAGTTLRLDGDESTVYNLNGGYMRIREGAVLEGTGSWITSGNFENFGLINPGKNDGANGEAGKLTFDTIVDGELEFDIFGTTDGTYDQILFATPTPRILDFTFAVNVWDKQDGALDDLSIGQEYGIVRERLSGGDLNFEGPDNDFTFTFDFSQSGEVLAARGLGWNTSDFASTGILRLQEVARLEFTDASTGEVLEVGATLTDGQGIKITNKAHESFGTILGEGKEAKILDKEVSNSGFIVTGLAGGVDGVIERPELPAEEGEEPVYHSTTGTVAFQNRSQALNGTHQAKLTLEVDHDTDDTEVAPVKHTIHLSETVTGNVAAAGQTYRAHVDAGDGFGGFSLTNNSLGGHVGTVATLKGGAASTATMLQMSFTAQGDVNTGPEGPQFFSDVLTLQGTGSDSYVLSMTYDVELYGALGEDAEAPMLAWFDNTSANMDDWEWVNAVLGNIGDSTPTFYEGAWQEDYDLGAYGWDATTNSVWAVLNHNSQFGVIESGLVPEPSRMLLVALGAATLMFRRRRRSAPAAC